MNTAADALTARGDAFVAAMRSETGATEGRFGGKAGIDAFTELRWITIETELSHFLI